MNLHEGLSAVVGWFEGLSPLARQALTLAFFCAVAALCWWALG
jgi:hypothetical protein